MKIVIDVPRDFCEKMRNQNGMSITEAEVVIKSFYEGTPLPKGHGRLIDADALYEQYAHADYNFDMTMEYAPTIIEAESEE